MEELDKLRETVPDWPWLGGSGPGPKKEPEKMEEVRVEAKPEMKPGESQEEADWMAPRYHDFLSHDISSHDFSSHDVSSHDIFSPNPLAYFLSWMAWL